MLEEIKLLSKEHNENFAALAVILFNTSHVHLIEALQKNSYVEALNEVTGDEITQRDRHLVVNLLHVSQPSPITVFPFGH